VAEDLGKERLKILGEIGNLTKQINAFNEAGIQDEQKATELNKQRLKLAKELRVVNQQIRNEQRQLYVDATNSVKGLGSLYDNLKKSEMKRIEMMRSAGDLSDIAVDRGNTLADINQKIAQLTSDQSLEREILQEQFDAELKKFEKQKGISEEIVNNLKKQNQTARAYSDLTEGQKEQLEAQLHAYDGIKKAIGGVLDTASLLFRGPAGFFGGALIGAGMFEHKLAEVKMQLGGISDIGTTALAFIDDNAVENVKALSNEFGGINNVSTELQASTSLISTNMGISGTEAASLAGSFARLNGNSEGVALDMIKTTQEFAKQNGIIPSQLMADLADSAEEFALYGKDGGNNILRAAGFAQKLGVSMKTLTGITDNLLDFESSITKELELSALMGKNINLDRARALAYEGDIEGATKATLDALGGVDAFNKMDVFQKKAAADLLGVQVSELQKMVTQEENADSLGASINKKFSLVGETISAGMNKYLGVGLEGLGGMVMAAGQLNNGFNVFGINMKGIISSTGQVLKNLLGMVAGPVIKGVQAISSSLSETKLGKGVSSIKEKLLKGVGGAVKPEVPTTPDAGGSGKFMESISKIKMSEVLKGAAAMLVVAAAVFVFGKAVQEFMKVEWSAVGMAVVSMLALVGAVALLGAIMTSGVGTVAILAGAAAMLVVATSVLILGNALQAIGTGFEMLGAGVSVLVPNLTMVADAVSSMVAFIPAIAALSLSLIGLAGALTAVGVAGTVALPGLLAIQAAGAVAGVVGGVIEGIFGGGEGGATGGEGGEMSALLDEIKGLRADLNSGKVAVYLDGKKVTSTVARVANTSSVNTYAKR
jgi:hypothetical protein